MARRHRNQLETHLDVVPGPEQYHVTTCTSTNQDECGVGRLKGLNHMKLLTGILVLMASASMAFAASKVSPDLPQGNSSTRIDVIVQLSTPANNAQLQQLARFGEVRGAFSIIKGIHLRLPIAAIQALAANPSVAYISPDRTNKGALRDPTERGLALPWR
jgi:hypothetical protein